MVFGYEDGGEKLREGGKNLKNFLVFKPILTEFSGFERNCTEVLRCISSNVVKYKHFDVHRSLSMCLYSLYPCTQYVRNSYK